MNVSHLKIFQRKIKPSEFGSERRTFSNWNRNKCLSNSCETVITVINQKCDLLYKMRWHRVIGEIPSLLLAKRVVLLVTMFVVFICFFGLLLGREHKRKSTITVVRYKMAMFHLNVKGNSYRVLFYISTFLFFGLKHFCHFLVQSRFPALWRQSRGYLEIWLASSTARDFCDWLL